MSINIHIEAHPDNGPLRQQIEDALEALGFTRTAPQQFAAAAVASGLSRETVEEIVQPEAREAVLAEYDAKQAERPTRERGQPSPGKSRRTKAEIAEDEAYDQAEAAAMERIINADQAAISTGENRVGPEDSPEDAAQDAADEAAETAANRDPAKPLTLDDVRVAVGRYQKLYGMPAVVADQPNILGCKMVEIPDTQEALAAAVRAMDYAIKTNPYGRTEVGAAEKDDPSLTRAYTREEIDGAVAAAEAAKKETTKADVIAAMKRYGKKYDGEENDPTKMPFASSDCTKVFTMLFGDEVTGISKVPATSEAYAKCVAGIDEMLSKNPFKRPSHA